MAKLTALVERSAELGAELGQAGRYMAQSLRLMVGLPDYGGYLKHMQLNHPEQAPMSFEAFFRERQQARYGTGKGKMCC